MLPERVQGDSHQLLLDGAAGATTATIPTASSVSSFASSSSDSPTKANYIEHRVTKMDTLAGIAIMYGVEVLGVWPSYFLVQSICFFSSLYLILILRFLVEVLSVCKFEHNLGVVNKGL